jgi:ATP-dependent helicase/nuclease subunit B
MQMLLYLASIVEDRDKVFGEVAPAGILYDQPLPSPSENGFTLSRDGILTSDISALTLMEKELKKKYIPAKLKNDGELDAYSKVVSEENFDVIFKYIKRMTANMGENLLKGHIEPMPAKTETTDGCKYCDFRAVCGKEENDREISDEKRTNQEIIELMKKEVEK